MTLWFWLWTAAAIVSPALTWLFIGWVDRHWYRPWLARWAAKQLDLPIEATRARLLDDEGWREFRRRAARHEDPHRLRAWFAGYDR